MNILVTGGAGYIGQFVCRTLARAGFMPIVYDNLSMGSSSSVRWGPLVEADILDRDILGQTFATWRPAAVIHLAGCAFAGESVQNPAKYYDQNVVGGLTLLHAMHENGVRRILFSSSCSVYGNPSSVPVDETVAIRPISPYGRTKAFFESMLKDFGDAYGFEVLALRYFNAAGGDSSDRMGERHDPEPHLIPRALAAAAGKLEGFEIFGTDYETDDGTCVRDYTHVEDLADAHIRALKLILEKSPVRAINVGSGRPASILDVCRTIERETRRRLNPTFRNRRAGDPARLYADISLAHDILGWIPKRSSLDEIIASAWRWHVSEWEKAES